MSFKLGLFEGKQRGIVFLIDTICTFIFVLFVIIMCCRMEWFEGCYFLYLSWLFYIAYVDYRTGYVYECMEYVAVFIVIVFLMVFVLENGITIQTINHLILNVIYVFFALLFGKIFKYGEGDNDILIVSCIMLGCLDVGSCGIIGEIILRLNFLNVSVLIFIILHLRSIEWKRLSLKEKKPFTPSVFITSMIFYFTNRL